MGSFLARLKLKQSIMIMLGPTGHVVQRQLKLEHVSLGSIESLSIHRQSVVMVVVAFVDDNARVVSTRTKPKAKHVPEAITIAALARLVAARI